MVGFSEGRLGAAPGEGRRRESREGEVGIRCLKRKKEIWRVVAVGLIYIYIGDGREEGEQAEFRGRGLVASEGGGRNKVGVEVTITIDKVRLRLVSR